MDISLKGGNGIELIKEIKKRRNSLPVLVVSMHDECAWAERCLKAGAKGYVMKQETLRSVIEAIRCILDGKIYTSENFKDHILEKVGGHPTGTGASPTESLTDRELEVFRMIGKGLKTGEIANELSLSAKTIGTHRERIKGKLGLRNSADLVRAAVKWAERRNGMTDDR